MKKIKLRNNPFKIAETAKLKMEFKQITKPPLWLNAMQLYPLAPKPLKQIITKDHSQFKNKDTQHITKTVPKITFEEDIIRQVFYEQHPFELDRPVYLIDKSQYEQQDWSTIHGFAFLCGERFFYIKKCRTQNHVPL